MIDTTYKWHSYDGRHMAGMACVSRCNSESNSQTVRRVCRGQIQWTLETIAGPRSDGGLNYIGGMDITVGNTARCLHDKPRTIMFVDVRGLPSSQMATMPPVQTTNDNVQGCETQKRKTTHAVKQLDGDYATGYKP